MRHSHARTMVQSIAAADVTSVSQTIAKPHVSGWHHPDLDSIRNNINDAKKWIEQAEQSLFSSPNELHFKRSINLAKRYLSACH